MSLPKAREKVWIWKTNQGHIKPVSHLQKLWSSFETGRAAISIHGSLLIFTLSQAIQQCSSSHWRLSLFTGQTDLFPCAFQQWITSFHYTSVVLIIIVSFHYQVCLLRGLSEFSLASKAWLNGGSMSCSNSNEETIKVGL